MEKSDKPKNIEMKQILLAAALSFWSCLSMASTTAAPVRAEIDALLSRLQSSGCQFYRNGSWYSASEAKDHLLRKLEHFEDKSTIQRSEQFIELAASKSSSSGKPYYVKCGAEAALESAQWLNKQLVSLRASSVTGKP